MIGVDVQSGLGLRVDEFDYTLPTELIAQTPLPERDASRLLVLDRDTDLRHHSRVRELADWLAPGDLLVANNSRVFPARLVARKRDSGGRVELLLLRQEEGGAWAALAMPARRLRLGTRLTVPPLAGTNLPAAEVQIVAVGVEGQVTLSFQDEAVRLQDYGAVPLPPYIGERLADAARYQTIYATVAGSAAAPTAGLHFTDALRARLRVRGIGWAEVTLHVGLDTFRPMTVERAEDHRIHREWCSVPDATALALATTKRAGGRVVAVGTTAARTLETLSGVWDPAAPTGWSGMTELFIVPGYRWRLVDAMLTNFHLPRSTLLLMISAFAGAEAVRRAYAEAIAERYRFFSFGDAMLIR